MPQKTPSLKIDIKDPELRCIAKCVQAFEQHKRDAHWQMNTRDSAERILAYLKTRYGKGL